MPVPASAVAAALRERLPALATKKLHKLLYYCQGHHLATFGLPLFEEAISAWDMGPVVAQLWHQERLALPRQAEEAGGRQRELPALTEAQLNTVGYVVSRYGSLTGRDLEHLTHSEAPWQRADADRPPGQSVRIELDWIREYFLADGDDSDDEGVPMDAAVVKTWLANAATRRQASPRPDSRADLLARLSPHD
jgi:uncharacterized phage-associated protein